VPAVLLLHAGVADRTMWDDHLEPFAAAGYRVVAPDLVTGGAPWADVVETLDALGIDRAALVGNSFGAAVALQAAAVAPERVSALVLVSCPPLAGTPSAQLRAVWDAEEAALERGDLDGAVDAMVDAWLLPDAPASLRERVGAMQRRVFEEQLAAGEPDEAEDPLEADPAVIERLELPALVAAGEHDMADFRLASLDLAQRLPQGHHTVIANAGHLAPLEQPEAFRAIVLAFLATEP
jgi:pimeloyl-ACP methyl ester carboxylesterase